MATVVCAAAAVMDLADVTVVGPLAEEPAAGGGAGLPANEWIQLEDGGIVGREGGAYVTGEENVGVEPK